MRRVKRGFTVHEMVISLTIMTAVVAIATHFALEQLRVFRSVRIVSATRSQLEQTTELMRNVLWSASPPSGDILVARDSAIELRLATGSAVACESAPGTVVIPAPTAAGNTLSSFIRPPRPGDRVSALFRDSAGATWLHLRVSSVPEPGAFCPMFPQTTAAYAITTAEALAIPAGAPLRFTRPLRLSLYKSSDNRWYLGARDWNGERAQFNAIQPVSGPLAPYGDREPGLRFTYHDGDGVELRDPEDTRRIATVTVTVRATGVHRDSAVAVVRLRNAR